jgi:hypothetical protein
MPMGGSFRERVAPLYGHRARGAVAPRARVRLAARRDGLHRRTVERTRGRARGRLARTKATQHVRPDELEVLSLVEPYKLKQNSLTLVRRTGRPSA